MSTLRSPKLALILNLGAPKPQNPTVMKIFNLLRIKMRSKTKTDKADYEIMRTDATLNRILAKKAKMQAMGIGVTKTKKAAIKGKPGFLSLTKSATYRGAPPLDDHPSRVFEPNDNYVKRKVKLDSWITNIDSLVPEDPLFKELPLPV